jgi:branched-subunit amino acid transport protein
MSDLALIGSVAVITFATRVAFLVRPRSSPEGLIGRFLDVFPLALFVAIAADALIAPSGSPEVTPGLAAALGGIVGGVLFRRALWAVLAVGAVAFYAARAWSG